MSNSYLDFDLEIGKGKDGIYSVQARWQGNEAMQEAQLPPDMEPLRLRQQIESVVLDAPLRRRRAFADNESIVKSFGQTLFDFALNGETLAQLRACQRSAKSQGLEGVRLRLRIFDPALAGLPWEYLYDSRLRDFIALDPTLPLVRYLHHSHAAAPLKVNTPLRILGMIASPINLQPPLDVEAERERVEQAVAPLQASGKLELVWLAGDSALDLQAELLKGPWHIFHFIGHGDFDAQRDEGYLVLCNPRSKQAEPLYATQLARLLVAQSNHLRFVLLNACESGRGGVSDIFSSTAETLINRDIPAVLAMQYAITDNAATLFAEKLYQSLVRGLPIDRSVAVARNALALADGQNLEWGVPVLHMRSPDGVLFAVEGRDKKTGRQEEGKREVPPLLPERDDLPVRTLASKMSPSTTRTGAGYALGVAILLVAGWLGWPYWRKMNAQTPTPTSTIAIALATDTPLAALNPTTSTLIATAATVTETSVPTQEATATETVAPADTATLEPTATATEKPTATDTLQPTATFTEVPTSTATPKPTNTVTPQPTRTNTPRPTATPTDASKPPINATIGTSWTEPTSGIEFVYVPAGEFVMGSSEQEIQAAFELCKKYRSDCSIDWYNDEKPQHSVQTAAYWIGKTEITNAQFQQFMDQHGYGTDTYWTTAGWKWRNDNKVSQPNCWTNADFNGATQPVVCVSWYEAKAYTEWLSQTIGLTVRLPTEAEWEKAARGAAGLIYPWGNEEPTVDLANYNSNVGRTTDVSSYPGGASPYGALDMAGNVLEWNSTLYKAYPYVVDDGREDLDAQGSRLLRGGSGGYDPVDVRGAVRIRGHPEDRDIDVGFRVVFSVSPGS